MAIKYGLQYYSHSPQGPSVALQVATRVLIRPEQSHEFDRASLSFVGGKVELGEYKGEHCDFGGVVDGAAMEAELLLDFGHVDIPLCFVHVLFVASEDFAETGIKHQRSRTDSTRLGEQLARVLPPDHWRRLVDCNLDEALCQRLLKRVVSEPQCIGASPDNVASALVLRQAAVIRSTLTQRQSVAPVAITVQPVPFDPDSEESLIMDMLRSHRHLGPEILHEAISLIGEFTPEYTLGRETATVVDLLAWLHEWTEFNDFGDGSDDEANGSPLAIAQDLLSIWRRWTILEAEQSTRSLDESRISAADCDVLATVLGNRTSDLTYAINEGNLDSALREFVVQALSSVPIAGNIIVQTLSWYLYHYFKDAFQDRNIALCKNARIEFTNGIGRVHNCHRLAPRGVKIDEISPATLCGQCGRAQTLGSVAKRRTAIERAFGSSPYISSTPTTPNAITFQTLLGLVRGHVDICDRYFDADALLLLQPVIGKVPIRVLLSDDGPNDQPRVERLRMLLRQLSPKQFSARLVRRIGRAGPHRLHDRFLFTADWAIALSNSIHVVRNALVGSHLLPDAKDAHRREFKVIWDIGDQPVPRGPGVSVSVLYQG